jgi:hypothetical protein
VSITPDHVIQPAKTLGVDVPKTLTAGSSNDVKVTAKDAAGTPATGYRGSVKFKGSKEGTVPHDYTFTAADRGSHTFHGGLRYDKEGEVSLTATDTAHPSITGTQVGIHVVPGALKKLTMKPTTLTVDTPTTVTVEGFDQFGNARDVSSQADLRILPENGCTNPASGPHVCIAHFLDAGPTPYHFIAAVVGPLHSTQHFKVVPKSRS